jgi:hypothetical protein
MPDEGTSSKSGVTLSEKMPFRITLGFATVVLGIVAGFHPWAVAEVRGIVQDENKITVLQQQLRQEQQFSTLVQQIKELTGEVRSLRAVVVRRIR